MSKLLELQRQLEEVGAAITRAERTIARHPNVPSLSVTLRSYLKLQESYQTEFFRETNALEMDVCSYKIIPDGERPTITSVTSTLHHFQYLFTVVYDSIINGPKKIAKFSEEVAQKTALGFGYTFPGSIGVMMTLDNKRGLFGESESKLDEAMSAVFTIMKSDKTELITEASKSFGVAAVRAAHKWAETNSSAQFGAEIAWIRKDQVQSFISLQKPEVLRLANVIKETSESGERVMSGEITMVDWDKKLFRMKIDGQEVSGAIGSAIDELKPANVPGFYRASLNVKKTLISDSESNAEYTLLNLLPP